LYAYIVIFLESTIIMVALIFFLFRYTYFNDFLYFKGYLVKIVISIHNLESYFVWLYE